MASPFYFIFINIRLNISGITAIVPNIYILYFIFVVCTEF